MKCPNCDGQMVEKPHVHQTQIGVVTVFEPNSTVMTCESCGTVSYSDAELSAYERRAARLVLTQASHVQGDVMKFARKALGLRQKDLATLLGTNEQQVSRWENSPEIDRRLRLAMAELLDISERDDDGLSTLAASNSNRLTIRKAG